jgi:hypothetical protein
MLTQVNRQRRQREVPGLNRRHAIMEFVDRLEHSFVPAAVLDAADDESDSGSVQSQLIERGGQVAEERGALAPDRCDFRKAPAKNLLACKLSITIRSEQF